MGAAIGLLTDPAHEVTVIDIGHQLEQKQQEIVSRMGAVSSDLWDSSDIAAIKNQSKYRRSDGLPQKYSYGSDYPFSDVGQLESITTIGNVNDAMISGAYGGLSNVWGSQVMPFSRSTFAAAWPISYDDMEPHYRAVLEMIPFAAEEDALAEHFPLIASGRPLPQLAQRSSTVLAAYTRHEATLKKMGILVGKARLAFNSSSCVRCGLCMTGCPYSLIYSAAQTFDRLRNEKRIRYLPGLLATEIGQTKNVPYVIAKDLRFGGFERFEADRLYVGCGAAGTTRLVMASLNLFNQDVVMSESAQFAIPMVSRRPTTDPTQTNEFTLNQFNMVVSLDEEAHDVSQIHFYPHSDALVDALPAALRTSVGIPVASQLLRRLTIGLGYLPSWESPSLRVRILNQKKKTELPEMVVSGNKGAALANVMFRKVAWKMLKGASKLDLWPILPMTFLSPPGKSYHYGGSLPHRISAVDGPLTTDSQGRLQNWSRVHMIDASVFPTIPATTFTLTIMANARRIAIESNRLSE